jgi:hypothetical protein
MVYLRTPIECFRCHNTVCKTETRALRAGKKIVHECFNCYRSKPNVVKTDNKIKQDYFCQKCRYKFKSIKSVCPYCNKHDFLTSTNITIEELL